MRLNFWRKTPWWGSSNLEPKRDLEEFWLCHKILSAYVGKLPFSGQAFRRPALFTVRSRYIWHVSLKG
jgi:hypothetical protein